MKNIRLPQEMVREGYITVQKKHPECDLFIYNYTSKAQYDHVWNEVTLACGGLILDADFCRVSGPSVPQVF